MKAREMKNAKKIISKKNAKKKGGERERERERGYVCYVLMLCVCRERQ